MLSRGNRLNASRVFGQTVRGGRRSATSTLVLHLDAPTTEDAMRTGSPRVGFVVSKAVGPAVTRNLVKRRLRHLARERVSLLPASSVLVVRAAPPAAGASYAALARDFDLALARLGGRS